MDHTKAITVQEIHVFLDSIHRKGVHPRAFKMLDELAHDHKLTLKEFKSWLVLATKFGSDKNSTFVHDYETSPNVGKRQATTATTTTTQRKNDHKFMKQVHKAIAEAKQATSSADDDGDEEYHSWNEMTMSQSVRRMQYAVRGKLVMRAEQLQAQGRDILFTNVGNPQAVGQAPITYYRQVAALCDLPALYGVDHPNVTHLFPPDVVHRAQEMRASIGPAGTGAYTGSQGILDFRQDVANYIQARDGGIHPAYPGNIFLTNGASTGIELILTTVISSMMDAIMIPIPQYPIYSALIEKLGGRQVGYQLDETKGWAATLEELEFQMEQSLSLGQTIKALVLINPGNPTGQVYTREDLQVFCQFCTDHDIVLLADEVYQKNIYTPDKEFLSAKKVALETPGCGEHLQLVSFHSTSKGLLGECGKRGGYMELHNIDPYVQSQLYKLASAGLCSNVPGQVMTSLMVRPPVAGDDSYASFCQEELDILHGLARRAKSLVTGLNAIEGISCNPAEGAMYAFPRVEVPPAAIVAAELQGIAPDTLYCLSLLEETGICVVNGSGFGQAEGRHGFRTTFLPPEDKMEHAIAEIKRHHELFTEKYTKK
jgi:alanine transaminase